MHIMSKFLDLEEPLADTCEMLLAARLAAHGITDDEQRIAMKAMIDAVIERSEILRNRLLNLSSNKPEVQS
jgi:hypothetical protein